eukprot:gene2614-3574_t
MKLVIVMILLIVSNCLSLSPIQYGAKGVNGEACLKSCGETNPNPGDVINSSNNDLHIFPFGEYKVRRRLFTQFFRHLPTEKFNMLTRFVNGICLTKEVGISYENPPTSHLISNGLNEKYAAIVQTDGNFVI